MVDKPSAPEMLCSKRNVKILNEKVMSRYEYPEKVDKFVGHILQMKILMKATVNGKTDHRLLMK